MLDDEIHALADPTLEQHFLVSREKLAKLIDAAGVSPTDRVVEVGAGVGTVAREIPPCKSLTLIEFDGRLIAWLERNVPNAQIIQGDVLDLIQGIPFDVLIGNLPNLVTESLIDLLPEMSFRTAVLAVGESANLDRLAPRFAWCEIETISGPDFQPPQPSVSRVVRIVAAD